MGEGGALRYLKAHGYIVVKREGIEARVSELGLDVRKLLHNVFRHSTAIFATVHSHGGGKPISSTKLSLNHIMLPEDDEIESTKMTPCATNRSTTILLWTISW